MFITCIIVIAQSNGAEIAAFSDHLAVRNDSLNLMDFVDEEHNALSYASVRAFSEQGIMIRILSGFLSAGISCDDTGGLCVPRSP